SRAVANTPDIGEMFRSLSTPAPGSVSIFVDASLASACSNTLDFSTAATAVSSQPISIKAVYSGRRATSSALPAKSIMIEFSSSPIQRDSQRRRIVIKDSEEELYLNEDEDTLGHQNAIENNVTEDNEQ
ncbi:hypothetical protein HK100_009855, partial [Physocladia obscura]